MTTTSAARGALAVLAASALAACTNSGSPTTGTTPSGTGSGPITIGASLSLTGDFSADGQAFDKGYELVIAAAGPAQVSFNFSPATTSLITGYSATRPTKVAAAHMRAVGGHWSWGVQCAGSITA
jgi:hypothetical protein